MSNSKPTFTFGGTGSSGSSGIFGQASNSNQTASPSATTASNPFGGGTNTQQSGFFGGTSQPGSSAGPFGSLNATAGGQKLLFGPNTASPPASGTTTPSLFGATTGNSSGGQAGGLFGGAGNTTGASNIFGGSPEFNFAKKADEKKDNSTPATSGAETPSQTQLGGLFGGASTTPAPSTFGAATPPSSTPAGSTTPAPSKPGGLFSFANSTTPAGPPPADSNAGAKAGGSGLFGSSQPSSGGLFPKPATTQSTGMFGGTTTTSASSGNPFAPKTTTMGNGAGLFSGLNASKPASTESSTPATSTSTNAAPKPAFSFTSTPMTSSPLASAPAPNPFGAASSSSSSTATAAPAQTTSLFGGPPPTTSSSSAPTQTSSLFSNLGKPDSATTPSAASAPPTTTSAPATSLFAPKTTQATSGTTPASSAAEKESTTMTAGTGASGLAASVTSPLAASNVGPAPQLSRLKNKTMDEIITRWATDLSTYQKEFQNQAAKVASWDRLLVENGEKIQKLYTSTFEAERASAEVERQLASVESQQDELTAWLDYYEREVDDMFAKQVGHGESLQGPDQERERTYKLAEKLTDRLDEMGKDLTSMIQEINTVSATLTKTSKPDDPLSQIVRVLNGHLSQLQWIDQNAAALQAKIAAAQKAGQSIGTNGYGGKENDSADDFYRSYMGRR